MARDDEGTRIGPLRWGLVPYWADDPSIGNRLINARSETAHEKPAFRDAFRRRRCLVLTDGFYEWREEGGRKQPYWVHLPERRPFTFAGLWERWLPDDGDPIHSFTILTTDAVASLKPIHPRMPLIIQAEERNAWLDREAGVDDLRALLGPRGDDELEFWPVSTEVNSPANDAPGLVEPVAEERADEG